MPPRGSGGWRGGDPVAGRRFAELGALELELGGHLPATQAAYETYGTPRREPDGSVGNAILVLHALTGDAHAAGPAGPGQPSAGWWDGLIGSGRVLDTDRWFVVSANVLGGCQGSTGPSSAAPNGRPWGSRFPRITARDQVAFEARLADRLGIRRFVAVLGGSMGGMRALEWVLGYPQRVGSALVLATAAAASAEQIATQTTQQLAITTDPDWRGGDYHAGPGPVAGLGLARRIAHLTYRSEWELDARFGREAAERENPALGGRFAVQSYLDHHAEKLTARFDAGSYVALTETMNFFDVGRGRGGTDAALASISVPLVVGGIESDRLYPLYQQSRIANLAPTSDGLRVIASPYGHDGFLIESAAVGELVVQTLARARVPAGAAC